MDVRNKVKPIFPNINIEDLSDNKIRIDTFVRYFNSNDKKYYLEKVSVDYVNLNLSQTISKFLFHIEFFKLFSPIQNCNELMFDYKYVLDENQETEYERLWWDEFSEPAFVRSGEVKDKYISDEMLKKLSHLNNNESSNYLNLFYKK